MVQWSNTGGVSYEDTWEDGNGLRLDGFRAACDLVDKFKASSTTSFTEFCSNQPTENLIGASADGKCMFRAMEYCMRTLNQPDWYSEALVTSFYQKSEQQGFPISDNGGTDKCLQAFVKFGNDSSCGPKVSMSTFRVNWLRGSVRSVDQF